MTLDQFLSFLLTGGAVILGAAFTSWLADNWPAFRAQSTPVKQASMAAVCLALALGAWAVKTYVPAETLEQLAAPFAIAAGTIAALLANQAWHALVNKANARVIVEGSAVILPPGNTDVSMSPGGAVNATTGPTETTQTVTTSLRDRVG